MTEQHPITPPEELVEEWCDEWYRLKVRINTGIPEYIATQAARWGADQELWACCELLDINGCPSKWIDMLRAARRPKPPSLAEQALEEIQQMEGAMYSADLGCDFTATRAALERLQQLEQENND